MRRHIDSLYGRLALVLLVALLAGFSTMYVLFRSHTDDNRLRNLARNIAMQAQMAEALHRTLPDFDQHPVGELTIVRHPPPEEPPTADQILLAQRLQQMLDEELGRTSGLHASQRKQGGFWVRLADMPDGEHWMFFALPKRMPHVEPWTWGLWVAFAVVFVGGLIVLWGVHKPLRRLELAMRQVGNGAVPLVDTAGAREIRSVAEQFNGMVERLRQYDQDRAVMLAGVAHDLRAPLTRLRLQLDLEDSPRHGAMVANLDGIESILDQFLAFAQGGETERIERVDLAPLLADIAAPYRARGVAIAEGTPLELDLRPASLRRALCNLLDNALEYGAAPVSLHCERRGGEALILVSDAGPGIAPERIDEALRPFSRLETARPGKGHCGLGLAIAARVAAAHGGRLSLRPGAAGGLVAELALPLPPA
jgi:two-component system osmolarity sensor histidine kinase EnvZ